MKTLIISLFVALTLSAFGKTHKTDLLIIGDSQNGGYWAKDYFGNHFQDCLTKNNQTFVSYARGGTQFDHWLNMGNLDHIETVYRDATTPQKLMGKEADITHKRLGSLIKLHAPARVAVFFGDNLVSMQDFQIRLQVEKTINMLHQSGIYNGQCIFITPTYEMQIGTKRNVPMKNFRNTLRVNMAIKEAVEERCLVLDGLELMKNSPLLLKDQTLQRRPTPGLSGCDGAAVNDNIHYCGQAAAEFARKVCELI
jgi:hypothetical protein